MADPASCSTSRRSIAGSSKAHEGGREIILFEHPGIVENVVAYLGLFDVLNLGSCSKYLNGVSESDSTWKLLYQRRWEPQTVGESSKAQALPDNKKGWKAAYVVRQKKQFNKIYFILSEVKERIQNDFLSWQVFHGGINQLKNLGITYDDIYSLFFSKRTNVILIMLGLYYAYFFLRVPGEVLKKAMDQRGVIDMKVCARWTLQRTLSYGFHMPEENYFKVRSLGEVVDSEMSFLYLMRAAIETANQIEHRNGFNISRMSYKVPEPSEAEAEIEFECNCINEVEEEEEEDCFSSQAAQAGDEGLEAQTEEECLEKVDHTGKASISSA
ncbi:F-box domain containing protein [Rhynchospora pubera]|uniref:F-box domain containing protein n=1 Tax=Rhynchospora pubera TaxID=906938 RepID=A0AAV8EY51_9POAL|nr:F-box domain containing protein [Rhynchospora pubera]